MGRQELGHLVRRGQFFALNLNGFEHCRVNLVLDTHGFEGQEHLAVGVPWAAEHGGNALEVDVGRQLLSPRINHWLEAVAMWAAIPEQLDHFDFAWHRHRYRVAQLDILLALHNRIGSLGSHAEYTGGDQRGAEDQITHASLLSNLFGRLDATCHKTGRSGPEFVSVTAAGTKKGGRSHPFHLCAAVLTQR
ncbi:hypothetical protein D3C84_525860 [compost metagenome]